jgi:hypothetical protein
LVEHVTENHGVDSSILSLATNRIPSQLTVSQEIPVGIVCRFLGSNCRLPKYVELAVKGLIAESSESRSGSRRRG